MITPSYIRLMAEYNAEMNRRLYGAAARLTDAERKADRGVFWSSIHGTLTHILWGDSQWMSRFDNWPKPEVPISFSLMAAVLESPSVKLAGVTGPWFELELMAGPLVALGAMTTIEPFHVPSGAGPPKLAR